MKQFAGAKQRPSNSKFQSGAHLTSEILLLINQGRFNDAEVLGETVLLKYADSAEAQHLMAIIYVQTQRGELAKSRFQKAIQLLPQRADFWGNLANCCLELAEFEEAVYAAQQSIKLKPDRAEVHNTLGNALYKLDRIEEALMSYLRAIELDADFLEALNNLALAYKALNRYADAERCFKRLLALQADFGEARQQLREVDSCWLEPLWGKRLYLRRFSEADCDYLDACYGNKDFMHLYNRFQPRYPKARLRELLLKEQAQHPWQLQSISWVIFERQAARPIGIASLVTIQLKHERAELLLGIPDVQDRHNHAALESMLLLLDFAFNRIGLNKITTAVYGDNQKAQQNNLAGQFFSNESFLRQHYRDPQSHRLIDFYGNALFRNDFMGNSRLGKFSERILGRNICVR